MDLQAFVDSIMSSSSFEKVKNDLKEQMTRQETSDNTPLFQDLRPIDLLNVYSHPLNVVNVLDSKKLEESKTCGIQVDDPEAQKILDKYLPLNLNLSSVDLLNIFRTTPYKSLNRTQRAIFMGSPLHYILMIHDKEFMEEVKSADFEIMGNMLATIPGQKEMFDEVFGYLQSQL